MFLKMEKLLKKNFLENVCWNTACSELSGSKVVARGAKCVPWPEHPIF